ncbi:hypothetical protein H8B09_06740 [Paenibacillus sp. PR3]|uniref:Uncharacterized protein n=1 Tax=Paenibacillus terricola TaxID=2763503 RepID=A0ABR8MR30_9BACL|nr:hypothetical protein [Paenibacillus terricola]MBD3918447.1 hypothetical protein [Paenibacillus terricola]
MKMTKKFILSMSATLLLTATGLAVWAKSDDKPSETVNGTPITSTSYISEHKSYKERRTPELYNESMKKWEHAKDKAINEILSDDATVKTEKWSIIPSADFDIEFTNYLSQDESNSFKDALFSDERKNNLSVGDHLPALLLNEKKDRAILTWLKGTGETAVIQIKSKTDDSGNRTWYVYGKAIIKK